MENQTAFDLSKAILNWRSDIGQSPAVSIDSIDELESHLRDSMAALQASGLTEEESFIVSARRIGKSSRLETEFFKVNADAVWTDRVLWIVIAYQIWFTFSSLAGPQWQTLFVILLANLFFRSVRDAFSRMLLRPFQLSAAIFVVFVSARFLELVISVYNPGRNAVIGFYAFNAMIDETVLVYLLSVIFVAALELRERRRLRSVRL